MIKYIKDSIIKLKGDSLSKLFYDFGKWILISIFLFIQTSWLPKLKTWVSISIELSVFSIIISSLILILITILFVTIIFRKKYKEIQKDNFTDELTGLKNHKALKEYLTKKIDEFKNTERFLSIILIDIDNFKKLNDEIGYNNADLVLKKVGELLGKEKRSSDETFRKFQRGDEFVVVLDYTSASGALIAAERRRKIIQNANFEVGNKLQKVTVSCGIAEFRTKEENTDTFIDRVNMALLEAKKVKNKNCSRQIV